MRPPPGSFAGSTCPALGLIQPAPPEPSDTASPGRQATVKVGPGFGQEGCGARPSGEEPDQGVSTGASSPRTRPVAAEPRPTGSMRLEGTAMQSTASPPPRRRLVALGTAVVLTTTGLAVTATAGSAAAQRVPAAPSAATVLPYED